MKKAKIFGLFLITGFSFLFAPSSFAQLFSETNININVHSSGKVNWVDIDGDGFLDFVYFFSNQHHSDLRIYINDRSGNFSRIQHQFPLVTNASIYFTDFNNNGKIDIILNGKYQNQLRVLLIENNPGCNLVMKTLPVGGTEKGAVVAEDLNNDGEKDIIVSGLNSEGIPVSKIYFNLGFNQFQLDNSTLIPVYNSIVKIYDINCDGQPDIFISGVSSIIDNNGYNVAQMYSNKNGLFIPMTTSVPGFSNGSLDFGDFNNNGFPDLIITGIVDDGILDSTAKTKIYQNFGNFVFEEIPQSIFGFVDGNVQWGDYDNDGYLDFFISGVFEGQVTSNFSNIFTNIRNGGESYFEPLENVSYEFLNNSYGAWGDYDNDGDLDIIYIGKNHSNKNVIKVITNNTEAIVNIPIEPNGLTTTVEQGNDIDGIILNWYLNPAVENISNGYTYNVRIGSYPGGSDIVSPKVNSNGKILIPESGNTGNSRRYVIRNLPDGHYYWSVQSVNQSYYGSNFSQEKCLIVNKTTLVQQMSSEIPDDVSLSQNFPNPFNPETRINFSINERTNVRLNVFNSAGQIVETILNEQLNAGSYSVTWNTSNTSLASGVYFYSLVTDSKVETRKMLLVK